LVEEIGVELREALEQRERETLAPQGRQERGVTRPLAPEAEDDVTAGVSARSRSHHPLEGLRRLKHKTQVFFAPDGRSLPHRLTHTLEVSQIARTIAKVLRLHEELTERSRSATTSGTRRSATPASASSIARARRLHALRAEPPHRRRPRERRPRAEPHVGGARRHRRHSKGSRRRRSALDPSHALEHARRQIMRVADIIATSITTSTTRCGRA
jgi:hypothetical protein